ncbi:lytic transglycosylase [Pseudomonas putida]|uniref:lytic transglycosylase n=1 Tax=Pseudomonas putida TaxID=303 RepID=UPI0023639230|nr:lytic transglycosylase [Pseudomonas putida]MDD2018525.1 lytic transglycosylase [Pseudomonas putida]HDS1775104.1 lytic transglycosylase [Pseudomonas putida]
MKMPVFYCDSWFRLKSTAIGPLSEDDARNRHVSGKPYVALISSDITPSCFVEFLLDRSMVGVGFLDDKCREYLTYQFQCLNSEKLFLTMATHREFDVDGKVSVGTSYIFKEDGGLVIRREKFNPYELEEANSSFDPTSNYEDIPAFGEYTGIIKKNR